MKYSTNYGLKLMEGADKIKRQDFVDNFTKIDTEMKTLETEGYPIIEATGTNAYIGASARIKSVGKGTRCTLFVGTDATGNCSLNLNGSGAVAIKDTNGNVVTNLKANIPYNLCHNGSAFILQGKGGGGGNLIPKYLLSGYYGEGDNGRVDGAMVNRGAPTANLNCGGTYNLQEGSYGGGKITANSLSSQTSATATAAQILSGYTAWVNGSKITGNATLQNLGGKNFKTGTVTAIDNVTSIKYNSPDGPQGWIGVSCYVSISNIGFTPQCICLYNSNNKVILTYINGNLQYGEYRLTGGYTVSSNSVILPSGNSTYTYFMYG